MGLRHDGVLVKDFTAEAHENMNRFVLGCGVKDVRCPRVSQIFSRMPEGPQCAAIVRGCTAMDGKQRISYQACI